MPYTLYNIIMNNISARFYMKKVKIASTLAATLIAASLLFGCGTSSTEIMGFKEISTDGLSYDLFVPDEWITDISTGVSAAYYSEFDYSNISVTAFELTDIISLEDYWATYEPDLKAVFADFEYTREAKETKLDGVRAMEYEYTGTIAGGSYKIWQIVAIKDARVHIFTYTAELTKFDSHVEDVIAMLDYFKFVD